MPTLWPQRRQPTRLPCPWDSPGKNTGVGCHFLLQCMKVKSESEVAQLCPTLSDPMDFSLPGSSIHGIFQARVLEWGAIINTNLDGTWCFLALFKKLKLPLQFSSGQFLSCVWFFVTPWIAACQASLSIANSQSSPKLMCIESVMPSCHLILCGPLLLLPPIPPSIRVFSSESTLCIRWPKYWSFSLSISPSNEHPGLVFFRMDWLDFPVVQGTLKSLLQYHSSKMSILRRSAFFTVQLSHPYMTIGKTITLTRWAFVGKVISLLFNMLSRLVITFLLRGKCLLISWLQLPSSVILEPQ